jgi:PleD family two-component response regulator
MVAVLEQLGRFRTSPSGLVPSLQEKLTYGCGTRNLLVRLMLLVSRADSSARESRHFDGGKPVSVRRRLVLCIDDEVVGSGHRTLLERHGCQVIAVTSDREGFSVLRNDPVDAIILDLEALGMSGDNVVRRMKEIKPHWSAPLG